MAKKIWYSSPLRFYWNELYDKQKQITPQLSDEEIFNVFKYNMVHAPIIPPESLEQRELTLVGLEMWRQDIKQNLLHVFFYDKNLKRFLEQIPLTGFSDIKRYLYENGDSKTVIFIRTKTQKNCVSYSFGLHIPYETDGYAFTFNIFEDQTMELFFSHGKTNGGLMDKDYLAIDGKGDKQSLAFTNAFRLAVNTISYMQCFPECVIDGVPVITVGRDEKRTKNNKYIEISDKVLTLEANNSSKMPHFRKGHFRLLNSDFYTKKKGQLVFVHETMVKGRAKTVYTNDDIKEIENFDNL